KEAYFDSPTPPKLLMLNFPHNPTTEVVDARFFEKVVEFALQNKMLVIHDLAYADICFDGYRAPSLLQVPGAKEIGVETFSLSKSYNMPGWRVGFCAGNPSVIGGLIRIKSYLDYGMFQPIQIAAIEALRGAQHYVEDISDRYARRRDVLVRGLREVGWPVTKPRATMFVWAKIPEPYRHLGSLEFAKLLLKEAGVAVSPGIGFGEEGDSYVRFALIENEERIRQGVRGIRKLMMKEPV
ncbi:MAG: aminotransferase class I/II-fold pyridoxal phosphate-dependent enzyme, partial [Balneolaceae bacterium]